MALRPGVNVIPHVRHLWGFFDHLSFTVLKQGPQTNFTLQHSTIAHSAGLPHSGEPRPSENRSQVGRTSGNSTSAGAFVGYMYLMD